jgi:hypothetical protein
MTYRANNPNTVKWASGINILAGLWLIIAPWIFNYFGLGGVWNSVIVGIIVVVLAAIRVFGAYQATWLSWVNCVLGLWMIASPWIFNYTANQTRLWNSVITGVIVAILGAWSALAPSGARQV